MYVCMYVCIYISSVKYGGPVETVNRDLGGARQVASYPVVKITIVPEPFMTMLLHGDGIKSDRSLEDCSLCLQRMFKDQPWLLWVSGETRSAARNSQAYHSNMPSDNSTPISTDTEATQTLLAVVSLPY